MASVLLQVLGISEDEYSVSSCVALVQQFGLSRL